MAAPKYLTVSDTASHVANVRAFLRTAIESAAVDSQPHALLVQAEVFVDLADNALSGHRKLQEGWGASIAAQRRRKGRKTLKRSWAGKWAR